MKSIRQKPDTITTDELLEATLVKKGLLVLIERYQNIAVCCVWGCIATDQTGCPCWSLSTAESTYNEHVSWSELDHSAMEESGLVWGITSSFTSQGRPAACVSLTWRIHGTRKHYGKKASRVHEWLEELQQRVEYEGVLTWPPKFPDLSNRASVGCAGRTSPIHGGPTS